MKKLLVVISWTCLAAVIVSARAQTVTDPNNTIVRLDVFTGGTNFGHIDIELFDQQKPETVRNFLTYVYNGAYTNILLHQPWPSPVDLSAMLQGGHIQINDPTGNLDIATFDRTPSFGLIPSEYSAGPVLPNEFGTIAAAPGSPVGFSVGSIDWVLNLANNPALNTNNGGYTVFGRVVNTQGEQTGTNLLKFFATNLVRFVGLGFNAGEDFYVPATEVHPERFPKTREAFLVVASVIHSVVVRDTVAPTVQVAQPAGNITNEVIGSTMQISGTAGDNQRVNRVLFDYGYPFARFVANGRDNWSSNFYLFLTGTNELFVRSVDDFGNVSAPVRRMIYYPFAPINLQIVPSNVIGKVIGLTNGQIVRLGVNNRLEAKPARGRYFLGWRGNLFSNSRVVEFAVTEQTDEFGQIFFPTNIFAFFGNTFVGLSNGTYHGLFLPSTNGAPRTAGWVSLNLGRDGSYSGRLSPLGATYTFRGVFDEFGASSLVGYRGTTPIRMEFLLYPEGGERIIGRYYDGSLVSDVLLFRVQKFARTNRPAAAGTYSLAISPTRDTNTVTGDGHGFASVTIDPAGRIKMSGMLGDEVAIKQSAKLLKYDLWPFYALVNGGREAILGWVRFTNGNSFSGDLQWWAPHFPGNTNQTVQFHGARYSNDVHLLNWTNGTITFSGGGLAAPVSADVTLNEDGSFTLPSNPNNVQLGFPNEKGQFSGTFNYPGVGTLTPLRGGALQGSSNIVTGSFGTKTNNGAFIIRQRP